MRPIRTAQYLYHITITRTKSGVPQYTVTIDLGGNVLSVVKWSIAEPFPGDADGDIAVEGEEVDPEEFLIHSCLWTSLRWRVNHNPGNNPISTGRISS